jgi:hypothetical protein
LLPDIFFAKGLTTLIFRSLYIIISLTFLTGIVFAVSAWRSLKKIKLFRAGRNFLIALTLFLTTLSSVFFLIANHGYKSFTREERAAVIRIESTGEQQFTAQVIFPDSSVKEYECTGDQIYIDAHILKWHPFLNLFGIHTTYEFDRLGGRYFNIEQEKNRPRTIHTLSSNRMLNIFDLRKKWTFLHPLLDAAYGSATFVDIESQGTYDIMVSTSGLLIRRQGL